MLLFRLLLVLFFLFVTLLLVCSCFFFFFSSRRRHTRCSRDWSSDVCSSDLPARIPASSRIVVPELPASSMRQDDFKPRAPRPVIRTVSLSRFTSAPRARRQSSVLSQSAADEKWRSSLVPFASAASMAYRCEMDLSPGGSSPPAIVFAGRMISFPIVVVDRLRRLPR